MIFFSELRYHSKNQAQIVCADTVGIVNYFANILIFIAG